MSETIKFNNERYESNDSEANHEKAASHEKKSESNEKPRNEHKESISHIRHEVQEEAVSSDEQLVSEEEDYSTPSQSFVNKELKDMALTRTLIRVRKKLSAPDKLISVVMHNPVIDAASEATAKTVGRPSGILGGGLLSFLGTSSYYYITKHYGYKYNFFIFLFLLILGFLLGWTIELLWKIAHTKRNN